MTDKENIIVGLLAGLKENADYKGKIKMLYAI